MIPALDARRERMVRDQLEARGIRSAAVLGAFRRIPREAFVSADLQGSAYQDRPLDIGRGQTISQPFMTASMLELLELAPGMHVLEIGTGSGYQTALLCDIGCRVHTVERIEELASSASAVLRAMGHAFELRIGDGSVGWPEAAPFDAIVVSAGAPELPITLVSQLAEGGRMAVPVGGEEEQELLIVKREAGRVTWRRSGACRFVKLVGREGWTNPKAASTLNLP